MHYPYFDQWWEFESQDSYLAVGASLNRFIRNQETLKILRIGKDLCAVLRGADAIVLAIEHKDYLHLEPDDVVMIEGLAAIADCFGILDDAGIRRYFELGWEVKGLGHGHIQRIKEAVQGEG